MSVVLKILNGAQAGAEMPLEAARYELGRDANCAIVLDDETLAPRHLEFVYASEQLLLLSANGAVKHQGTAVEVFPHEILPLEIFTAGGIALSYGAPASSWPDEDAIAAALESSAEEGGGALVVQKQAPAVQSRFWGALIMFCGVGLLAGAGSLGLALVPQNQWIELAIYSGWHGAPDKEKQEEDQARAFWQTLLAGDAAFAHVRLVEQNGRVVKISGWTQKTSDRNRLLAAASIRGVETDIQSMDQLKASMNLLVDFYGERLEYRLAPSARGDLSLALSGVLPAHVKRMELQQRLRQDLPSLKTIKFDIVMQKDAIERIESYLAHHPALAGLRVEADAHGLLVSGALLDNYRALFEQARVQFGNLLPVGVKVRNTLDYAPAFDVQIESVLIGASKRIQLRHQQDNLSQTYYEEDRLPDNFTLDRIERDRLVLRWNDKEFLFPFGGMGQKDIFSAQSHSEPDV